VRGVAVKTSPYETAIDDDRNFARCRLCHRKCALCSLWIVSRVCHRCDPPVPTTPDEFDADEDRREELLAMGDLHWMRR
jgi:hypothetical protein